MKIRRGVLDQWFVYPDPLSGKCIGPYPSKEEAMLCAIGLVVAEAPEDALATIADILDPEDDV